MMPKLAAFDAFADGLAKCGVLVRLKISSRNCSVRVAPSANCRNTLMSKLAYPGPRMLLNPAVPNRRSVTGRNADVSNQGLPGPIPPRISTVSFTWSATWLLPFRSSDVAADSTVNGDPEYAPNRPFTCQPPSIAAAAPPLLRKGFPVPNGS